MEGNEEELWSSVGHALPTKGRSEPEVPSKWQRWRPKVGAAQGFDSC